MIDYDFPLYRPPAEANNIIIQATYGCSFNGCTFCSMYKTKKYTVRPLRELYEEIDTLSAQYPEARRVFLADGDALALDTEHLLKVLSYLQTSFKNLGRVSVYATAQNLLKKTEEELQSLHEHKLSLLYFGIETGNKTLLEKINKGVDADDIVQALNKASRAKIKVSATVILGLGGKEFTAEHIEDTALIINKTCVNYLSTLHLGLDDEIKKNFYKYFNHFQELTDAEVLDEQKRFLRALSPSNKVIFRSNHASNALHLAGTLPRDTNKLIQEIQLAQESGEGALVPKMFRAF